MESEAPETNQEHNNPCNSKCGESCYTLKKWIRDPNGWIAICTICLVLIGLRALHTSQDTEKRQLRAYVATSNIRSSGIEKVVTVELDIENYGQTPAKNCRISFDFAILTFPLPKRHAFQIPLRTFDQKSIIVPRATKPQFVSTSKTFTDAEITALTSKDAHYNLCFFGILTYEDIFGDSHFTNFCSFMILDSTPKKDELGRPTKTFKWSDCDQNTDFN